MPTNYQRGTIYEPSGSVFGSYLASVNGEKKRGSHKLWDREIHYSITCPAVLALRDEHMVTLRRPQPKPTSEPLISDSWESDYLPTISKGPYINAKALEGFVRFFDHVLNSRYNLEAHSIDPGP